MNTPTLRVNETSLGAGELLSTARFLGLFDAIADHVVKRAVLREALPARGVSASTAELQEEADTFRRAYGLHDAQLTQEWLSAVGYSLDDFEAEMEYRVLVRKLREGLTGAEVEAWFHEHRADLDRARVSHLVAKSEGLAQEVIARARDEGQDFRALAMKHSLDPATREAGGYLGWVGRADLDPQVAAKVFAARAGDCVGPLQQGPGAWQVLHVEEVRPAALDDDARAEVREALLAERIDALVTAAKVETA